MDDGGPEHALRLCRCEARLAGGCAFSRFECLGGGER
jgi:hypothetical protein